MLEKPRNSTLKQLVYSSPILPVLFLAIFALFILAQFVRLPRLAALGTTPLVVSNLLLLLLIALRFIRHLLRLRQDLRYDAERRPRKALLLINRPVDQVRADFAGEGYRFDQVGRYGEKRNHALLGSTIIYGGLLLVLLIGTYDYMFQFSGSVFNGVGSPMDMSDPRGYYSVAKGPLTSISGLPRMQIKRQILPNSEWPKGAVEIALLKKKGDVLATGIVERGGKPLRYKGYDYYFNRSLFDAILNITTNKGFIELDSFIKFQPLNKPEGKYTFYSSFNGERYRWNALFDPERKAMRLVAQDKQGTQVADGEIIFQQELQKEMGSLVVRFNGLSSWSEMHIVHARHMYLLVVGALIAAIGALLRLAVRPQRVWLDEAPDGCRAWAVGGETKKLVNKAIMKDEL
jgi:hypothetical protein